jgi:hypothetical protein
VSDIDTVVVDSLKTLDPKRPIREGDIAGLVRIDRLPPLAAFFIPSACDTEWGGVARMMAVPSHSAYEGVRKIDEQCGP